MDFFFLGDNPVTILEYGIVIKKMIFIFVVIMIIIYL